MLCDPHQLVSVLRSLRAMLDQLDEDVLRVAMGAAVRDAGARGQAATLAALAATCRTLRAVAPELRCFAMACEFAEAHGLARLIPRDATPGSGADAHEAWCAVHGELRVRARVVALLGAVRGATRKSARALLLAKRQSPRHRAQGEEVEAQRLLTLEERVRRPLVIGRREDCISWAAEGVGVAAAVEADLAEMLGESRMATARRVAAECGGCDRSGGSSDAAASVAGGEDAPIDLEE